MAPKETLTLWHVGGLLQQLNLCRVIKIAVIEKSIVQTQEENVLNT